MYERLREVRKGRKTSAIILAQLLGFETKAAYYKKESGITKFTLTEAKTISDFFSIPIEELFFANEVSEMDT